MTRTASARWHYCWVAARTRVKRLGPATDCAQCKRHRTKHKCGLVTDAKLAWKDYPVEDCAGCASEFDPGEFPEGPKRVPPVRAPSEKAPEGKLKTGGEPRHSRQAKARAKAKRLRLLVLAVGTGLHRTHELKKALTSLGVETHRQSLHADLQELVDERWLIRSEEANPTAPRWWTKKTRYRYEINPGLLARLQGDETG